MLLGNQKQKGKFEAMKSIRLSTANSESYSSISNIFIDHYMTDANGDFVKIYLYLIRLLNSQSEICIADIADHFNLTEKDICRAIKYWVTREALQLTFDENGQPTGIVILPLKAPNPDLALQADAISLLRSDAIRPKAEKAVMTENPAEETPTAKIVPITASVELSAPAKPRFSAEEISSLMDDANWENILILVETFFNKPVSQSDMQSLLYIYETLSFSYDLFEYLIEYCSEMGKRSCRYLEATAVGWYQDNIQTRAQAKELYGAMSKTCRLVYKTLGIRRNTPTTSEQEIFKTWTRDYGFDDAIIEEACIRAVTNASNPSIKYVNATLTNWHNAGVKTRKDIAVLDEEHNQSKKAKATQPVKKTAFHSFTQSSMKTQLDEMEQLFHQEVNQQ